MAIIDSENVFIDDTLANKYKDNERELKREYRHSQMQRDGDARYRKKLSEWLLREQACMKAKQREAERADQRKREKQRLI